MHDNNNSTQVWHKFTTGYNSKLGGLRSGNWRKSTLTVNNWSRKVLPSGLSTNLKHLQVSQNVNKSQYEYIQTPPCGRKRMCVHVNNVNMTSRMRREKYGRHENSNTSENITLNSSLNARRFDHQIYLQTVDRLGFSVGELRTITLWTGETIAVQSHHDSASNFARLPWICAHPPTRSTLAYGLVRVTTECHKNESARLHTGPWLISQSSHIQNTTALDS